MQDHQRTAGEWLHLGNQRRPLMPAPHVPYEWQDHRGAWYATHTKTKSATFGSLSQNVSDTSFVKMIHVHPSLPNSTHVYKFFLLETAILSQKYYFSQTFAMSTKNFRGPPSSITCGNIWTYIPRNRCGLFTLHGGPWSPSPASSDTSTPKLRAHLPPVSLETRHNKSTV